MAEPRPLYAMGRDDEHICWAIQVWKSYMCTRARNHTGPHVAHVSGAVEASRWYGPSPWGARVTDPSLHDPDAIDRHFAGWVKHAGGHIHPLADTCKVCLTDELRRLQRALIDAEVLTDCESLCQVLCAGPCQGENVEPA